MRYLPKLLGKSLWFLVEPIGSLTCYLNLPMRCSLVQTDALCFGMSDYISLPPAFDLTVPKFRYSTGTVTSFHQFG